MALENKFSLPIHRKKLGRIPGKVEIFQRRGISYFVLQLQQEYKCSRALAQIVFAIGLSSMFFMFSINLELIFFEFVGIFEKEWYSERW